MNKRVEGVYSSIDEAMAAIDRLRDEGYSRNSIHVVANENVRRSIPFTLDADVTDEQSVREDVSDESKSLWDRIKDAFTVQDYDDSRYDDAGYDAANDSLAAHRADLQRGNIVILLDNDAGRDRDGVLGDITTPADPVINEGVTGDLDSDYSNDTNRDLDLEEDVKATDPPLLADMEGDAPVIGMDDQHSDLTTSRMVSEPPSKQTVNDVNVPLNEELDLADEEREEGTPPVDPTDPADSLETTSADKDFPAEPGMPRSPDDRN